MNLCRRRHRQTLGGVDLHLLSIQTLSERATTQRIGMYEGGRIGSADEWPARRGHAREMLEPRARVPKAFRRNVRSEVPRRTPKKSASRIAS